MDTQTSLPQGEVCNLHPPEPEPATDDPAECDTGGCEKTPRQAELTTPEEPAPSQVQTTPSPALCPGNPAREAPDSMEAEPADDQFPPTDWRSGYEILLHLGLIRYLTEAPDLTQAGAQAAQAEGLSLTAEDWQSVARTAPEVTVTPGDEQVSTPRQTPEMASSAQIAQASEPDLQADWTESARNPTQPDAAQSPDEPEDTTSACSGLHQPGDASDLPSTHWAQAERPVETPTRSSGLRSLTADRQPGGFPRRSYAGMPRPRVAVSVDEDIQALRQTRAQMRSDEICQAIAQFLSRRHHRTARLRQIGSALCGTLINGEEVFDSDITDGINTLVDKGRIVLLSNGDIFLLNPPDI